MVMSPTPEPRVIEPSALGGETDPWSLLEDFASVVGHELRTPIGVVKGAAETALAHARELDPEELAALLRTVARNADLALLLVDRIGLARDVEQGTVDLAREPVDLAVLVTESVSDLAHVILDDHDVEVDAPEGVPVSGDPTALREIVFNLLSNAAKYSARDARIAVSVRRDGGEAHVVVRNHGGGVTPSETQHIFEKFFQSDPGSPGSGLGLYISRGLARAHGGDLQVQPADDEGSEFILIVPASL